MLRSFRVANHKSIRDEQELSLMPAYDKTRPVLPVAAIYGPNAAGKSNLLDALRWMREAILHSFAAWQPDAGVPRTPFQLDPEVSERPSAYVVEVIIGGVRHTYGFEVDDERVRQEWLYTYPRNRRRMVFEREGDSIQLGSTIADSRSRGEVLAGLTRPNSLLLSVAARSNEPETQALYAWFHSGMRVTDDRRSTLPAALLDRLANTASRRHATLALIKAADLGIRDVQLVRAVDDETLQDLADDLDRARRHRSTMSQFLGKLRDQFQHARDDDDRRRVMEMLAFVENEVMQSALLDEQRASVELRRAQSAREEPPKLVFLHGERSAPLQFDDGSAGTRTWLSLLTAALDTVERGALLVVDELDLSLHPHLTGRLVNLFRDAETNPRRTQIVFTTHDATLLDEDTLSRDEIWFVDKDVSSGATRLFPLTDFHPRKNENTEGRYLAGSYGAVPVVFDGDVREAMRQWRNTDDAA